MRWMRNVNFPFWRRCALAVVLGGSAATPAWAQYKPYFSSVREVVSFHVHADASSVMTMEITRKAAGFFARMFHVLFQGCQHLDSRSEIAG